MMADGALNLTLDDETAARLAEKAKALGIAPETLAIQVIRADIGGQDILDDPRRDHVSNYDLNEEGRDWDEVRPALLARLKQKLAEQS